MLQHQSLCVTTHFPHPQALLAGILILLADREQMWRCLVFYAAILYGVTCRRQQGNGRVNVGNPFKGKCAFPANILDQMCCAGLPEGAH